MQARFNRHVGDTPSRLRVALRALRRTVLVLAIAIACVLAFVILRAIVSSNTGFDVVLITLDTQRRDFLGCYGGQQVATPSIDRLARSGVRFDDAVTVIPRTTQGIASILTGRYPRDHGVHALTDRLPDSETTLAEVLRDHGFRTAALVNGGPLAVEQNLYQGFETMQVWAYERQTRALPIVARAIRWLFWNFHRRYFLWVHIYDDHFFYSPPWPFWNPLDKRNTEVKALYEGLQFKRLRYGDVHFRNSLGETTRQYLRELYGGEVESVDYSVGLLLRTIRVMNFLDPGRRTLVILTADHGESLGEKDYYYDHGNYLYEADLRIPLVLSFPGTLPEGRIVKSQVRNIDVFPTVLDLLGINLSPSVGGESLLPLVRDDASPRTVFIEGAENVYPENTRYYVPGPGGRWEAVRDGRLKLIRIPHAGQDEMELYDVVADPGETRNLAAERPSEVARLQTLLREWSAAEPRREDRAPAPLDEDTRRKLRALGYAD